MGSTSLSTIFWPRTSLPASFPSTGFGWISAERKIMKAQPKPFVHSATASFARRRRDLRESLGPVTELSLYELASPVVRAGFRSCGIGGRASTRAGRLADHGSLHGK